MSPRDRLVSGTFVIVITIAAVVVIRVLLPSPTEAEDGLQDRFGRLDRRVVEDVDWPAFRSVTAEGLPISSESLRGRIWIADFLALECSSCPGTTLRIADLQERTAASNVLFVSRFTRKLKPAITKLHYSPDSAAFPQRCP